MAFDEERQRREEELRRRGMEQERLRRVEEMREIPQSADDQQATILPVDEVEDNSQNSLMENEHDGGWSARRRLMAEDIPTITPVQEPVRESQPQVSINNQTKRFDISRQVVGDRLGSIEMPMDKARPVGSERLGSLTHDEVMMVASDAARRESEMIGDDLAEAVGNSAFDYPPIPGKRWITFGGGAPWNQLNLGYIQDNLDITVTAGYLWIGIEDPIAIAETLITLASVVQDTWIHVEHVFGSAAATVKGDIIAPDDPVDDATTLRWPLTKWQVTESDEVYTAVRISFPWVGDIKIPLVRP